MRVLAGTRIRVQYDDDAKVTWEAYEELTIEELRALLDRLESIA